MFPSSVTLFSTGGKENLRQLLAMGNYSLCWNIVVVSIITILALFYIIQLTFNVCMYIYTVHVFAQICGKFRQLYFVNHAMEPLKICAFARAIVPFAVG